MGPVQCTQSWDPQLNTKERRFPRKCGLCFIKVMTFEVKHKRRFTKASDSLCTVFHLYPEFWQRIAFYCWDKFVTLVLLLFSLYSLRNTSHCAVFRVSAYSHAWSFWFISQCSISILLTSVSMPPLTLML